MAVTFHYNRSKIQIFKVFSGTLDPIIRMHATPRTGMRSTMLTAEPESWRQRMGSTVWRKIRCL